MATTVGASNITFNDSTTQGTAWAGYGGQVFNSSGTFTIPTGVTKIKATIIGGGQSNSLGGPYMTTSGNNGGTTTIQSGTQAITTIGAYGGSGQCATQITGGGDSALGGTVNQCLTAGGGYGYSGDCNWNTSGLYPNGSRGSGWYSGAGNAGGVAIKYFTGLTPGLTIGVTIGGGGGTPAWGGWNGFQAAGAGNAGQVIFEW